MNTCYYCKRSVTIRIATFKALESATVDSDWVCNDRKDCDAFREGPTKYTEYLKKREQERIYVHRTNCGAAPYFTFYDSKKQVLAFTSNHPKFFDWLEKPENSDIKVTFDKLVESMPRITEYRNRPHLGDLPLLQGEEEAIKTLIKKWGEVKNKTSEPIEISPLDREKDKVNAVQARWEQYMKTMPYNKKTKEILSDGVVTTYPQMSNDNDAVIVCHTAFP